jgi:hypothetical protein
MSINQVDTVSEYEEQYTDNSATIEDFHNDNETAVILGARAEIDSTSEQNKIKLDDIVFNIKKENLTQNFYCLDKISKEHNLYNILSSSDMLIFINNKKIIKKHSGVFNCFSPSRCMEEENFPGCTFLPFEYVSYLKKYIHELNTYISTNDLKNIRVFNDNDICNSIYFDEGEIKKNCVYKKMEVMNKIIFIPLNKYQLKQTEYKIRGFCQIAEELGANKIEIKFQKNNNIITNKKLEVSLGAELDLFAGSLGLVSNSDSSSNENQNYILEYPSINTISLNEKNIIKKIRKKKIYNK